MYECIQKQIGELSLLLYIGSPESKKGDERKEEKLDLILKIISPEEADDLIKELDIEYPRK